MNAQEFFIDTPPYAIIAIDDIATFKEKVIDTDSSIRTHCRKCNIDSVFIRFANECIKSGALLRPTQRTDVANMGRHLIAHQWQYGEGYFITDFACSAGCNETLIFVSLVTRKNAIKIGQSPSYADLTAKLDKKYHKVLSDERFDEFNRAIGLTSHDIGIGAFVYLRRIIEDMVEVVHAKLKTSNSWDEKAYQRSHFSERLDMVKDELPSYLVENSNVYGIISKGIHELSEKECLLYFPVVRDAIEIILDEKIEKIESEIKKNKVSTTIANITGKLRS